jgi:uncharacterized protein YndB with AHSA1/START domain
MTTVLSPIDHLTLTVRQETEVRAPIETTFAALLEQLGPGFDTPDGATMPLMLEAWPGGRWFRDLGNGDGHWWAVVQAIKRPTLLELSGPMFMSYPVASNIQYRLTESNGGTLITFHHLALGLISDEHRKGVDRGWSHIHARVRSRAEGR